MENVTAEYTMSVAMDGDEYVIRPEHRIIDVYRNGDYDTVSPVAELHFGTPNGFDAALQRLLALGTIL